jgi:hypothetical protein
MELIMAKESTMTTIERTRSLPMAKAAVSSVGKDATLSAVTLVAEMFAAIENQAKVWHSITWRIIDATTDARVEIVRLIDERLAKMREENRQHHGKTEKNRDNLRWTRANVDSYTVQASCMRTVARAFNAGATVRGMAQDYEVTDPRNMGYMHVVNYARTFVESEGKGRKADSFKVALKKFLDKRAASLANDTDKVNHQRAMQFLETLQD